MMFIGVGIIVVACFVVGNFVIAIVHVFADIYIIVIVFAAILFFIGVVEFIGAVIDFVGVSVFGDFEGGVFFQFFLDPFF